MSETPTTGQIVKNESARQMVILVFGVVGTILTVWVVKYATKPDRWRTFKMRTALTVKRVANGAADACHTVADKAATAYWKETESGR